MTQRVSSQVVFITEEHASLSDQATSKQAEANAALDGRRYMYLLPAEDSRSTTTLESEWMQF